VKIFFVAVFDKQNKSTNNSQLRAFKSLGHEVHGCNYRSIAAKIGNNKRDLRMVSDVATIKPDLVVYSKCNDVSFEAFKKINQMTTTCLWFMDPLVSYTPEMKRKTRMVDFFCCDKKNVLKEARKINQNSFHVCEGFDEFVDKPHQTDTVHDVSFIGNIYGNRSRIINNIDHPVKIISNAYGENHSIEVSKSKINLNFCTTNGASDRVYKILAAKGFLITNDWEGRGNHFEDNKDLIIYEDMSDLNNKIEFFLKNKKIRQTISQSGMDTVQQFNRTNWAKNILKTCGK